MTAELVKRAKTEAWRSSVLGLKMMLAASLLWSVVCVLVLLSVGILHVKDVTKAIVVLSLTVVPGTVLVGAIIGYWIASARLSPIGVASIAGAAAVTLSSLLVSFVAPQASTVAHGWVAAALGGALIGLTAAPFWFIGALVLYGAVERRQPDRTARGSSRAGVLSQLIRFCLSPSVPVTKVANPLSWGCHLFGYNLFFTYLSAFFVALPIGKYLGASPVAGIARAGPWMLFLLAPIVEELTFRLPLRYTEINLTISALLVTLFTVRRLLTKFGIFGLETRWLWSGVFAILVASVVFLLLRTEPIKRLTKNMWLDHFGSVLYLSCFAFGLLHIFNFRFTTLTTETLLLAPLLALPQLISGFILAFARMRLGMIWCIVLHAANNVLAFWLLPARPR